MQTRVWPLGREGEAQIVEHEHDECPFCVAARDVRWGGVGGVIFFTDGARVARVEYLGSGFGVGAVLCDGVELEQARAELAAYAEG